MSRPTRKRTSLEAFLNQNPDIEEPEMVEDNVENLEDSDDDGGEYVPSSPDLQLLEDADDDDVDDPASPKMATSKKITARAETRNKRTQKK